MRRGPAGASQRDRRFVAAHRGGPLNMDDHRRLAEWAAACAERVVSFVADGRPRRAIDTARAWARGEATAGEAQRAAWAAHAAARDAATPDATAAARAAGHAAATAHMADHSLGAALYACRALAARGEGSDAERVWQLTALPDDLRPLVASALAADRFRRFDVAALG